MERKEGRGNIRGRLDGARTGVPVEAYLVVKPPSVDAETGAEEDPLHDELPHRIEYQDREERPEAQAQ